MLGCGGLSLLQFKAPRFILIEVDINYDVEYRNLERPQHTS
jgi:hypothetical protein